MHFCSFVLACWLLMPLNASAQALGPSFELPDTMTPKSISCGATNRGALSDSSQMPIHGLGFVMAEPWRSRGTRYGTRELVSLVQRASGQVATLYPGSQLSVADMSKEQGGPIASHRSHQSGRDVDLIYYAMNASGAPFFPDSHMAYYTDTGEATFARAPRRVDNIPKRYFDLKRNWALVRALVFDTETRVEHIFVSRRVKRWLIHYATELGEPPEIVVWANKVLHFPKESRGHNDHMHVRIGCSAEDLNSGQCHRTSAPKSRRGKWNQIIQCPRPAEALVLPWR